MTLRPMRGFLLVLFCIKEVKKMLETNKIQESIFAFDQAIRLSPDYAEAYHDRAIAKGRLGQHEEAIADLDQAIYLKPDYVVAYCNRGIAKSQIGKYEAAIADYDQGDSSQAGPCGSLLQSRRSEAQAGEP